MGLVMGSNYSLAHTCARLYYFLRNLTQKTRYRGKTEISRVSKLFVDPVPLSEQHWHNDTLLFAYRNQLRAVHQVRTVSPINHIRTQLEDYPGRS